MATFGKKLKERRIQEWQGGSNKEYDDIVEEDGDEVEVEEDEVVKALEYAFEGSNKEYDDIIEEDGVEVEEDEGDDAEEEKVEEHRDGNFDSPQDHQQFQRLEYEALAERKRKALADSKSEASVKKARQDVISGASFDEIVEAMNYCMRKRSRKLKERGRRKGSKNKLSPELTRMLGDATVHYGHGRYEEVISVLNEVVRLAPHLADSYHTLGLAHEALGNTEKAMAFFTIAARLMPKDSSLWIELFYWHKKCGDIARASMCLSKAIKADPTDINLRRIHASLYCCFGNYQRAAESFEQVLQFCPKEAQIEALKTAAQLYVEGGLIERSISIIEQYLKSHPTEVDISVIVLLADLFMETNAHNCALQHIEHAQLVYYSGGDLPLQLKIKAGICHAHLGNIDKAEMLFSVLQHDCISDHRGLITEVADAFRSLEHFHYALKYYLMLESYSGVDKEGFLCLSIAQCYCSMKDREKAIMFFYKALPMLKDSVDARLSLVSLLIENGKDDEAISLLSPPENLDSINSSFDKQNPWWLNGKVKLKLCHIYRTKGTLEDFVTTALPLVRESLYVKNLKQKVKKRLTMGTLRRRIKILDVQGGGDIFGGVRPWASRSDLLKATRARKMLQKKEEERAAGVEWSSDDSDDQSPQEVRVPPLPNILNDKEHHDLITDLCRALQSLKRYRKALKIIRLTRKLASKKLSVEKEEELQSLEAQISCSIKDPKHGFDCVRSIVYQHPQSIAAWNWYYKWNCYSKLTLRLGKSYSKHEKFLRKMRAKHNNCAPPLLIKGHHFTMVSHHQDAAREYLEACKLVPESPLANLCSGTALINLTLCGRLQNKHQCLVQGLAFLYKNLQLTGNSQEALYNIGRAYHHVGLVSLAASYYQLVLATSEKDYPFPKFVNEKSDIQEGVKPGYCNLHKEAAYNLHLIYKQSGAFDLARQVLKDHCTV